MAPRLGASHGTIPRKGDRHMLYEILKRLRARINEKAQKSAVSAPETGPDRAAAPDIPAVRLEIPEGTDAIPREAMAVRKDLVSVSVPGSVKTIGARAFAECENLARVTLSEGLERIDDGVFSGCKRLKSVVVPDSVRTITGDAFRGSGVTEPVLNASKDTLIYCPAEAAGAEYTVPEGVRRILSRAFAGLSGLKQVHFPKSLECIDVQAFVECGLTWASLPRSVAEFSERAFFRCKDLCAVGIEGEDVPARSAMLALRARGLTLLKVDEDYSPPEDPYWREPDFRALAASCVNGNVDAMERMVGFFEEKFHDAPDEPFYFGAANFWRVRAFENGSKAQGDWLGNWLEIQPGKPLPSACLTEELEGADEGSALNALGFSFFEPDKMYCLDGLDRYGVVEVSGCKEENGPEKDSSGREIYYDKWYLDGDLRPVPGVECLHIYNDTDRPLHDDPDRFAKAYAAAAEAVTLQTLQRGLAFEQQDRLDQAYDCYSRAVKAGSDVAMFAIGNLCFHKNYRGVKNPFAGLMMPWDDAPVQPDVRTAFNWFLRAAKAGNVKAMSNVGVMLYNGAGCAKDPEQARRWLEKAAGAGNLYAAKALHDLFETPVTDALPDEEYDRLLDSFCDAVSVSDSPEARAMFERLMNGTEDQISRLGLRLAEGRYGQGGAFWEYSYPNLSKDRSCAPVVSFRCGWASAVLVDLRVFPEGEPVLTFASDIGQDLVGVWGIRESGETAEYNASPFGWLGNRRRARILRPAPGYRNDNASEQLESCGVDIQGLLEHLKLTEHDALFIENGEKEYSVEIGHIAGGQLRVLLRYTIGGWDQGDGPANVSGLTFTPSMDPSQNNDH